MKHEKRVGLEENLLNEGAVYQNMRSQNIYGFPLKEEDIQKVVFNPPTGSHDIFINPDNGEKYDERNAIDFLCEEGKKVLAPLGGEVVRIHNKVKKTWDKNYLPSEEIMNMEDTTGNYVMIKHPNEEFSVSGHLQLDSMPIKVGQRIKEGEVIGLAGNTGWSLKPHVHYVVFKFLKPNAKDYESLQVKFNKDIQKYC